MSEFSTKALTAFRLGLPNLGCAIGYKVGVCAGISPVVLRFKAEVPAGPFCCAEVPCSSRPKVPRVGWYKHAEAIGLPLPDITPLCPIGLWDATQANRYPWLDGSGGRYQTLTLR
jgi:hypothetical protein